MKHRNYAFRIIFNHHCVVLTFDISNRVMGASTLITATTVLVCKLPFSTLTVFQFQFTYVTKCSAKLHTSSWLFSVHLPTWLAGGPREIKQSTLRN
jgi:hypothetical protein